ncbi:vWA domain-containing protein [Oceanobacillus salinisoli]|uniref:vWA domain-containing protein n=1 Tax=Oceanobacillus salinisoli TaxID=2678611 RepID=UPI0012E13128|nr:VWA domain-containing protein [Oceanobacillus salinisoli]
MFNQRLAIIFFIFILFLAACSSEETTSITVDPDNENNDQSEMKNEDGTAEDEPSSDEEMVEVELDERFVSDLQTVSLIDTLDVLKAQQGGLLVKDISIDNEVENTTSDPLSSEQIIEMMHELDSLIGHTQDPYEIYSGIVYLLGSPNYQEAIEKAENFVPDFEEPYLPNPGIDDKDEISTSNTGKAIILLDASSSMLLSVDGRIKLDIAKDAVKQLGEVIGRENEISVVVYGHKGSESESDKELSCNGIEEIYPMGDYNKEEFEQSLTTFESKGYTPLAGAIQRASEISMDSSEAVAVYIVSGGVDTCDGDPAQEAEAFINEDKDRTVNIIGFDVDKDAEEQLKQVSVGGNGTYYPADNAEELKSTIEEKWLPTYIDIAWAQTQAPGPWEVLDEYNRFDVDLNQIREIIKTEKSRYDQAVQIMRVEGLADQQIIEQVSDLVIEEYRNKLDIISEFRSEKLAEIDQVAEDIRHRVEEWKEEMSQQTQERGDVF